MYVCEEKVWRMRVVCLRKLYRGCADFCLICLHPGVSLSQIPSHITRSLPQLLIWIMQMGEEQPLSKIAVVMLLLLHSAGMSQTDCSCNKAHNSLYSSSDQ